MDLRTWQEAGVRAGSYSARHRARSPFSPLRPAPIAVGSLSTAAIAAFAFVAPGLLHGGGASAGTQLLDGMPNRVAALSPGSGGAAPAYVSVTAPSSSTSDSPVTPTSTSTAEAGTSSSSSSPSPLTIHSTSTSPASPRPTQPQPSQSQAPTSAPTSPGSTPTVPPTTTPTPVAPPTTNPTVPATPFNSSAAVSSALAEIGSARSQQDVSTLSVDSQLSSAARVHAADMARTGDFSHIGSDGSDPFSRAAGMGCFTLSQELIAHGRPGDDVIGALMRDPSSRRALLSFWNTSIGISAQLDRATGDVYWTIELGWG